MRFGITIPPEVPLRSYIEWAQIAEDCGFEIFGVTDSQSIRRELYMNMAGVALNTKRIRFGPRVTNPVTRHPAVTASALATADEVAPGRVLAAIGSGFAAVKNIEEPPAKLADLRDYVTAIRDLHVEGTATWRGKKLNLSWGRPRPRIPLFLSAHGPKTLQLAGEVADGVVVGTGVTREVVADSLEQIRIGAKRAGRNPDDIEVWWLVMAYIAGDRKSGVERIRTSLAAMGHELARPTTEGKFIPPALIEPMKKLNASYQALQHVVTGAPGETRHNAQLLDDLGLTEYLAERYAIAGSVADCVERLKEIEGYGVDKVWLSIHFPEKAEFMRQWSRDVMARFDSGAGQAAGKT